MMSPEEYNKQFMEWLEFLKDNPIDGSMDSCDETIKPLGFDIPIYKWASSIKIIPFTDNETLEQEEDTLLIPRQININKMIDILLDHKNQGYEEVEFTMDDDEIMIEGVDNQ